MNTNTVFSPPTVPSPPASDRPAPRFQCPDRSRTDPYPLSLDERIEPDHPVRSVWDFVRAMDLRPLTATVKAVEGHPGRTPIDVRILVALWLYATLEGISSAFRLDKLCRRDDDFKWICGGVSVNYHTLADFRTDHADWLQQQIVYSVALLRQQGLVELHRIGQDGLRVRASAGSSSFKKHATLQQHLDAAQRHWDAVQAEAHDDPAGTSRRQQRARQRAARERLERLQQACVELKQVEAAREARKKGDGVHAKASSTDPEARVMKMPDGGFRPAYNVQFATDLDSLVVVGVSVTNAGSDGGQMEPMVEHIEQQHGQLPREQHADGSYSTHEDIERVSRRGVTVYTPVKDEDKKRQRGEDPFAPRKGDAPEVAAWRQRMGTEQGRLAYRQRSKCEWTNATCRNRGLYRLVVRGLAKVQAVACWHGLAVNFAQGLVLRAAALAEKVRAESAAAVA